MSENRKGTCLKQCQKCQIDMNGDMLDVQGVCLRCKAKAGDEPQNIQKDKRDPATYHANDIMDTEPAYSDFISCDRSGRRNAVHELQGDATALKLEKLASTIVDISIAKEENQEEDEAAEKKPGMTPENRDDCPTL
ncbi:cAMP-dependent protein kinase inhibitor gamma, partial [Varanus komodoensis]